MNVKRNIFAWYLYDFAVSGFTTSVLTVFIGPYLTTITKNASVNGYVNILGISIYAGSFVPYVISLSVILQVFLLPYFAAIGNNSGKKTFFFNISVIIGAISTTLMYFLEGDNFLFGGILLLISNLAFGISMVFYNSFLNNIVNEDKRDEVSSKGYAYGYFGGGLLLIINLILVLNSEKFNLTTGDAVRISLASAGLWWFIFSIFPILKFKNIIPETKNKINYKDSFKSLLKIIKDSFNYPKTLFFIIAYIFYNDGVQAVIVVSSQFGQETLNLSISSLTTVILMVQFVAFFGALLFSKIAEKFNTKNSLLISIVIWILSILYAFLFLKTELDFYILAFCIGIVLGGTQALSRSLYSLLIPKNKQAEYFSLYEISERGTSWIGPLLFGISLQFTASYQFAIFSLIILFIIGFVFLYKLNIKEAILEAGNNLPKNFISIN